jgi:hypothetical protein
VLTCRRLPQPSLRYQAQTRLHLLASAIRLRLTRPTVSETVPRRRRCAPPDLYPLRLLVLSTVELAPDKIQRERSEADLFPQGTVIGQQNLGVAARRRRVVSY